MASVIRAIVILLVLFSTVLAIIVASLGEAYLRALPDSVQGVRDWLIKQGVQVMTRGRSVLRGTSTPAAPPTLRPAPRPTLMPGETSIDLVLSPP